MRVLKIMMSCLLLGTMITFAGCGNQKVDNEKTETTPTIETIEQDQTETRINRSAYSWDRDFFDENPGYVLAQLSDFGFTRIYQGLYPADLKEPAETEKMVKTLTAEGMEVVYLTGDPDWEDPTAVKQWTIELLCQYNGQVTKYAQIHSICFDVEFYSHEGWDNEEHFRTYTEMMKEVIEYAHEKGFKVILCAPYWLTDFSEEVYSDLIASVDELSCMIYLVGQEEEKLAPIYKMCSDGNTRLEIILETQPVSDEYDVYEYNTYACNGGKSAVLAAAQRICDKYPDISIGFHSIKYMLELK